MLIYSVAVTDYSKVIDIPARDDKAKKPVYCFVEFYSKDVADEVLRTCNLRTMRGRQVRIDHSRRGTRQHLSNSTGHENTPTKPFNALTESEVDISKLTIGGDDVKAPPASQQSRAPRGAGSVAPSSRLFVGGLPSIENTNELDDLIMELFRGFHVYEYPDYCNLSTPHSPH